MAAEKTVYTTVKMDDDRVVDFAGKRKMIKEALFGADGSVAVRMDFVNGETRTFTIPDSLMEKCAAHGASQKFGDEIAGLEDVEDCILAVDDLFERLAKGEWTATREKSELAGTSVLARALMEHTGKTREVIKDFLSKKTQSEKVALRQNSAIAPIVAKLESEKVRKPSKVDTEALLGELA